MALATLDGGALATLDGWAVVLALARVAPAIVVAPLAGGLAIPRLALGAVALATAAVIAGGLAPAASALATAGWAERLALLGREAAIGSVLGVVAAVPLAAAATAGALASTAAGDLEPATGPWSNAIALLGAVVFFAIGGHLAMVTALGASYRALPAAGSTAPDVAHVVGAGVALFGAALGLAAPLLVAAVIAAIAVAVVERAVGVPAVVPELALRRVVVLLVAAVALFGIAMAIGGETRALPAALARAIAR